MNRRSLFKLLAAPLAVSKPAAAPVWNFTLQKGIQVAATPKYGYVIKYKRFPSK